MNNIALVGTGMNWANGSYSEHQFTYIISIWLRNVNIGNNVNNQGNKGYNISLYQRKCHGENLKCISCVLNEILFEVLIGL
jgi:hypothetical protein